MKYVEMKLLNNIDIVHNSSLRIKQQNLLFVVLSVCVFGSLHVDWRLCIRLSSHSGL